MSPGLVRFGQVAVFVAGFACSGGQRHSPSACAADAGAGDCPCDAASADCDGDADARPEACDAERVCDRFCCAPGEDCLGARCAPRAPCTDRDDCDDDTRCLEGNCVPWEEGGSDPDCVGEGRASAFAPVVQCEWKGGIVSVPPLVVDLGGEDLDGVATSEIVVSAAADFRSNGFLAAIDGETCEEVWRTDDPLTDVVSPPAAGDLDGDGHVEIAVRTMTADFMDGGLAIYDVHGAVVCESDLTGSVAIQPAEIANLDGAGDAEVLLGLRAFDSSCHEIWDRSCTETREVWGGGEECAPTLHVPIVADVDRDGAPEVVTGKLVLDGATGETEVEVDLDDGRPAVADFDRTTPEPEIAVVAQSGVRIQTVSGDVIFGPNRALGAAAVTPGAPTIADFDGDGEVEMAAVGVGALVVFDPDCEAGWDRGGRCDGGADGVLWQKPIQDHSSGETSATTFDFDGDGVLEVVYADECFLRAFEGPTGALLFTTPNANGTAIEYPTVADVDGDGSAEFVVARWDSYWLCGGDDPETGMPFEEGESGIRIFGDADDLWMPARPIWNQHAYSVTGVEDDGAIPVSPARSWEAAETNTFRVNGAGEGGPRPVADLTVAASSWEDACPEGIVLGAVVANRGPRGVDAGVEIVFRAASPKGEPVCRATTTRDLGPGETEDVHCTWAAPGPAEDVYVNVDPQGAVAECSDENGDAMMPAVGCGGID